jgi:hypothetical protein
VLYLTFETWESWPQICYSVACRLKARKFELASTARQRLVKSRFREKRIQRRPLLYNGSINVVPAATNSQRWNQQIILKWKNSPETTRTLADVTAGMKTRATAVPAAANTLQEGVFHSVRLWNMKDQTESQVESDPRTTALARTRSNCKRQTRPLVRESAPYQQTRNCPTAKKKSGRKPQMGALYQDRLADWPSVVT